MKAILPLLLSALFVGLPPGSAHAVRKTGAAPPAEAPAMNCAPDSKQIETELQHLRWKQFRSIVESIASLKSGIDAYGPIGWQFVQANYTTYPWKKNIDKLDAQQKKRLIELIQNANGGKRNDYCGAKRIGEIEKRSPEST